MKGMKSRGVFDLDPGEQGAQGCNGDMSMPSGEASAPIRTKVGLFSQDHSGIMGLHSRDLS